MDHAKAIQAVRAARMYYYQGLTTEHIAREMHISRSTVSRLLSFAKAEGLVEIRIVDPAEHPQRLEKMIVERYGITKAHVVPVPEIAGEVEWLERVAQYTANYLNRVFTSDMILGVAWGTTLTAVAKNLRRKTTHNAHVVQLNGAGNMQTMGIEYASEIIMHFADNYGARAHLFPVPAFFDFKQTKAALWKERSIARLLRLQQQAHVLLYSVGATNAAVASHVYSSGYLEEQDYAEIRKQRIVGDIATVFFKDDGSFDNIPLNARASGPDLQLFQKTYGICVVSGLGKVHGLHAALKGKLMTELIIDEPTARALIAGPLD